MIRKKGTWFVALVAAAFTLASCVADAQTPPYPLPSDYPNLGGSGGRPGHNGSPTTTSPGFGYIGWEFAYGLNAASAPFVVDNTDFANTNFAPPFTNGPYDFNARGSADSTPNVTALNNSTTTWGWPNYPVAPFPPNQATGYYDTFARLFSVGTVKANYAQRNPAYFMTACTPSAPGSDPTAPENPSDFRFFDWNYKNAAVTPAYVNIYVSLPVGPTQTSVSGFAFPVRYYVYEVFYYDATGVQQTYVQVVDSYAAGSGFYQLGKPTNFLAGPYNPDFPVNNGPAGKSAVTVRLLNTVPRDPDTGLLLQTVNGQELASGSENAVKQFLVYADAVRFSPDLGAIYGTPTVSHLSTGPIRATITDNLPSVGNINNANQTTTFGEVFDFLYNDFPPNDVSPGVQSPAWSFLPIQTGVQAVNQTASNTPGFTAQTGPASFQGTGYYTAPISTVLPQGTASASYTPTLVSGTYQIYAYIPGNATGQSFATQERVDIMEGANVTTVFVDASKAGGWVQLGNRRYNNFVDGTGALSVIIRNYDANAADAGTFVYANIVRFIGASNLNIVASPIHAQAHIALTPGSAAGTLTDVVIVADENGVIHCLDANGNGNGTTTEYWSYPSTPNTALGTWFDPNINPGKDLTPVKGGVYDGTGGTALAEMPTGFGLSTGVVQSFNGLEYLFVTTTNGRAYCISMLGRGDFNKGLGLPGTTQRVWTYPATYPSPVPVPSSKLGAFQGSPSFGQITTVGNGTVNALFLPTMQGRIYALNAFPNNGSGTTSPLWEYPAANQPTLGSIAVTPAFDTFGGNSPFPMLFFGTEMLDDNPGVFMALNANTGLPVWSYTGITDPTLGTNVAFDSFISSPCTVAGSILNATPTDPADLNPVAAPDTVYTINGNNYVYAFNAETGALAWQSNELPYGCLGGLSYAVVTTWDLNGNFAPFPMLMVPTSTTQRFYGLFARAEDATIYNGHLAWGSFPMVGQTMTGQISNGDNWMYAADTAGYMYAYDNIEGTAFGNAGNGFYPPNSPVAQGYKYTKVRIITQAEYNALVTGGQDYATGTSAAGGDPRSPVAFDWGETAYVEVYDFPYSLASNSASGVNTSEPAQANITVTTEGHAARTATAAALQFATGSPTVQEGNATVTLDGYAIYPFTFMPQGQNATPPGTGSISTTLTVYGTNGAASTMALPPYTAPVPVPPEANPPTIGWSNLAFIMANPLAIEVPAPVGSSDPDQSLGLFSNPQTRLGNAIANSSDPQNAFNGSKNVPGSAFRWDLLMATPGQAVNHNQTTSLTVNVYDRSLLGLVLPPGQGITNVRVDRHDIAWEGDQGNITSMFNQSLYPNLEDLPINYPNTSLDYPNITQDSISVTANPNTNPVNVFIGQGATLLPPAVPTGTGGTVPVSPGMTQTQTNSRVGVPTPFKIDVAVPQFQPANTVAADGAVADEFGGLLPQGYKGRMRFYVDSAGTGEFTLQGPAVDTYRGLNLALGVAPSWNFVVATPNLDLGLVSPGSDFNANLGAKTVQGTVGQASPWPSNPYYQPLTVLNEGNVNGLDLRMAKASSLLTSSNAQLFYRWGIFSSNNDSLGFLDSYFDVWSNIDVADAPLNPNNTSVNNVPFQKARPGDTVPSTLSVNPIVRTNYNNSVTQSYALYPNTALYPTGGPTVGVTVPVGLPVGNYSQVMRIVENAPTVPGLSNEILDQINADTYEAYTDPSFTLSFTVGETRLTGNSTPVANPADPMLEAITSPNNTALGVRNVQPTAMRDAFGSLDVAWVSDRSEFVPTTNPSAVPNPVWRIYFAGLGNQASFQQTNILVPPLQTQPPVNQSFNFTAENPLGDIDWWKPSSQTSWFNPSGSSATGYPNLTGNALLALFPNLPSGQTVNNVSFGSPAFPADGQVDKLGLSGSGLYSDAIMGFVGEAQLGNSAGVANAATGNNLSALFLAPITTIQGTGAINAGAPVMVAQDYSVRKGKPAIVQRSSNSALVFYPGTSANASEIYYTYFNGTSATSPYPLNFGGGFQSIDSVSALARYLQGSTPVVELTFGGKLRGLRDDQMYMGRLALTGNGAQLALDGNNNPQPFMDLAPITFESLSASTASGIYQSRGVSIDTSQTAIHLVQVTATGTWTNLLMDGYPDPTFADVNGPWDPANFNTAKNTGSVDRGTGIITYDTRLGGKVYIDPTLGTVRFVGGVPSPAAVVRMSYQSRFLRISNTDGAYSSPTGMFDTRYTSDPLDITNGSAAASFVWRVADGSGTAGDDWATGNNVKNITNDRYVFTYNRVANGSGLASRPYMTTKRIGVPLEYPLYVSQNGTPGYVLVQWNLGGTWGDPSPAHYYQVDPANGKIYFEGLDEGQNFKITYQAADPSTGALLNNGANGMVTEFDSAAMITESKESPILMSNAVNETDLDAFLDPFSYQNLRRPPLMWMFWSSTRAGSPDVWFQTLSPMLLPRPIGVNQ